VDEQLSSRNKKSSSEAPAATDSPAPPALPLPDEQKTQYETLITDLYHQLDDKVSPAVLSDGLRMQSSSCVI